MGSGIGVYAFAENLINKNIVWVGTSKGLYVYNKITKQINRVASLDSTITITHIEALNNGDIWFSSLEKGMGVYHQATKNEDFFPYQKINAAVNTLYPIQNFCIKSPDDFFVAVKDSTPAIFNTTYHSYKFLNDTSFVSSKNNTTDIKLDSAENFYFIKGGLLYSANISDNKDWIGSSQINIQYTPLIYGVTDFNRREITNYLTKPEMLKDLKLGYKENSIIIYLTSNYYSENKPIQYEWKLDGNEPNWVEMPVFDNNNDSSTNVELPDLKPGKYLFHVKVRIANGPWSKNEALMKIVVAPPFWAAWWFWLSVVVGLCIIIFVVTKLRIKAVRKQERLKAMYGKEALELEAKALRAQMNPHFIFNCMNSIKSLIQEKDEDNAVNYLTTFSKLLRTVLQNCDKSEITLFDEIEMCRLYTELESMRFGKRLNYYFNIDATADLKSVRVPTLILQPFIENAIWHGIMPKEDGGNLTITVKEKDKSIVCMIDDDGIGRDMSKQNKFKNEDALHQSKGLHITQTRIDVDNLLNERKATVEIIDKKDESGKSTGTKVILVFVEE